MSVIRSVLLAIAVMTGQGTVALGQRGVVDVQVSAVARTDFFAVGTRAALGVETDSAGRAKVDTLRLSTPASFAADLNAGAVMLIPQSKRWITVDVLLVNGSTLAATAPKLQIGLEGKLVYVKGVP
jgi:hypothetical protein